MPTITTAAAFWTARTWLDANDTATRTTSIETIMRLALQDGGAVGERAAELLAERFGVRVVAA